MSFMLLVMQMQQVIIIPDFWGWRSGRTRNIADLFANAGELI
jgi:hypothetical protein